MISTNTRAVLKSHGEQPQQVTLYLPFTEDEYTEALAAIGIVQRDDEDDLFDLLMSGEPVTQYETKLYSDMPEVEKIEDLYEASDIVERIENLKDYEYDMLLALLDDGDTLDEALENIDDGDIEFYPDMDLAELAEQFADEGIISKEVLESHIDWEGVGRDLSFDGYREVRGGVLYRY